MFTIIFFISMGNPYPAPLGQVPVQVGVPQLGQDDGKMCQGFATRSRFLGRPGGYTDYVSTP